MMALMGMIPPPLGAAIAAAMAIVAVVAWLRMDAARDARQEMAVRAAQHQEEIRHEADKAARDAERDGAADRLRSGRF
jgi:hypothetical protein